MNNNSHTATLRAAPLALVALLLAPAATATDGDKHPDWALEGQQRHAALTESFDRDTRRIIRESRDDLRAELDASVRAEMAIALTSRRALTVRR